MHSVRSFIILWSGVTLAILGYAVADLALHPELRREMRFSMQPDLARLPELVHWGGRLVKEGHVSLLVANAITLGGLAALLLLGLSRLVRSPHREAHEPHDDPRAPRPSMP